MGSKSSQSSDQLSVVSCQLPEDACSPFDRLRANGSGAKSGKDFPFVLSSSILLRTGLSKHERRSLPTSYLGKLPLCLSLSFFLLSACPRPEGISAKEDLTQYIDKARLWAATEAQINNAIATVREDQFVHDDVITGTLRPVVGVSQEYVQQLENYQPRTPPLRNVHLEYIEAWRAHYLALASIIDSVEKKDYIQLAKSNNDLLEAQRSVSDALADLARLMREAGLRSDSPKDQQSTPPAPPSPGPGFEVSPKGS
jgi:hypothetical protein